MAKETKKAGRFQWFLFIVIPAVFAITVTLVVLNFAGVDVLGTAKKAASNIPVVSSVFEEEKEAVTKEPNREKLLQEELKKKEEEISNLTEQNEFNERTIEELNQEIVKLKNRIDQETVSSEKAGDSQVKDIARSFEEMDAEAAAAIVNNLEQEVALTVLENIPTEVRGSILEAMDPAQAASLTSAFLNSTELQQ